MIVIGCPDCNLLVIGFAIHRAPEESVNPINRRTLTFLLFRGFNLLARFRLLDLSSSPDTFLWMSLMTRVVEAIGSAVVYMGVFAVVLTTFPNSIASTYVNVCTHFHTLLYANNHLNSFPQTVIEFCYGFGIVIGPILGALLYQASSK